MPELPKSEKAAIDWLDGNGYTEGNWAPTAAAQVAWACMRHGLSELDYETLIVRSALGSQLADRSEFNGKPGKLDAFLAARWQWAEDHFEPATGSADVIRSRARELMIRVFLAEWPPGQTGITQRMVALALVSVAVERGAYSFDCSVRFLAAKAGVSDIESVSKARKALADRELIELVGRGRQLRTARVNLAWRPKYRTNNLSAVDLFVRTLDTDRLMPHDVFTRATGGIGPAAGWVWALTPYIADPARIKELLGLSRSTFNRATKALADAGLEPESDLDVLAERLGVGGYREDLRSKFAVDQAANKQERLDWYSAKVQDAVEYDKWFTEHMATMAREAHEKLTELNRFRVISEWLPDPFDHSDNRVPVFLPAKLRTNSLVDPWGDDV